MRKFFILLSLLSVHFAFINPIKAQSSKDSVENEIIHRIGLGIGLSYGTIGGRYVLNPTKSLGLFLGLGYNLVSLGYNVGSIVTIPTNSTIAPYFSIMYGSNSVIKIEGMEDKNKTYNGFSAGLGIKIKSRRDPGEYWDLGIIIPNRSQDFKDDYDEIKNNPTIEINSKPWPVLINVGYNFKI